MATLLNGVFNGTFPTATILGGNQARPNQHPPVKMNGNPSDALMTQAVRDGIIDTTKNYTKAESGILLSISKADNFIIKPNFEILIPEFNSGIILAR